MTTDDQATSKAKLDRSISLFWANVLSILWIAPLMLLFVPLYSILWGAGAAQSGLAAFMGNPITFLLLFGGGIVAHEVLHGLTWQWRLGRRGVVEYGVKWRLLTPYAHLKQPVSAADYRIATWMPGVVVGFAPMLVGLFIGLRALFWFGILFTWAAGGDMLVLWQLRGVPGSAKVEDHPSRAGCYVYQEQ
ncbi:MAG: DUF3267 domain-containing protein [Candidatus Promineifilaceae bacterium]|nr:DUF3267 domain-containing protein [Candidatus Promineifilaceae bacterium]